MGRSIERVAVVAETQASRAEAELQRAILTHELAADARLTLPMLAARYGYGATPLREALSRLTASGLVEAIDNRGFRVVGMSQADLRDITTARIVIETGALRLAMRRNDGEWQDTIIAAMNRLGRAARASGASLAKSHEYEVAHKALHLALIAGCNSPRLSEQQDILYDAASRYRRKMTLKLRNAEDVVAVHQALVDQVLGHNIESACAALATHLTMTLSMVYPPEAGP